MNELPELACPEVLRIADGHLVLVGSRCMDCGEQFFPAQYNCANCAGTKLVPCDLGGRGTLWSWTVQGFLPKEPYNSGETEESFRPYGVGYVQMPSGIKIESRLTVADPERLHIGMSMHLILESYRTGPNGSPVHTYAFGPASEAQP